MAHTSRVPPTLNGEGAAPIKATPIEMRLATQLNNSATVFGHQAEVEARQCERIARRHALAALRLCGALALQQTALSAHYAQRSVALMREVGR